MKVRKEGMKRVERGGEGARMRCEREGIERGEKHMSGRSEGKSICQRGARGRPIHRVSS